MANHSTFVVKLLENILAHSSFARELGWEIDLIANPMAGAFRRPDTAHFLQHHFSEYLRALGADSSAPNRVHTHLTSGSGTEKALVENILRSHKKGQKRLVVIAGGDGTANHALSVFVTASSSDLEGISFFRVPLGTGNDYADAPDLGSVFHVLSGKYEIAYPPYLEYNSAGKPWGFGFNIGSIGLDAWVVMLNAKLRKRIPGNFYKLAADLSGLFYKGSAKPSPMTAELFKEEKLTSRFEGEFLLTAFAPEGHRVYGGGIKVLPGDDNLCRITPMSLWSFLTLKDRFYKGLHLAEKFTTVATFDRAVFYSSGRLAGQYDGEVFWLEKENFPYIVTVKKGNLPFLRPLFKE